MIYLNRHDNQSVYAAWSSAIQQSFTRQLGYGFELKSLCYSLKVVPGGVFHFCLKFQNVGFAAVHLHRYVYLILDNSKTS